MCVEEQVQPVDRLEERVLVRKAQRGDTDALDKLIRSNYGIIVKVVKRYACATIDIDDLIQEGIFWFIFSTMKKFDLSVGTRVSTVAEPWIRQGVNRYIYANMRTIRLPIPVHMHMQKILAAFDEMVERGVVPTTNNIADATGINEKRVDFIMHSLVSTVSFDSLPSHHDEPSETEEFEDLVDDSLQDMLSKIVDGLPEKEAEVVRIKFGLDGSGVFLHNWEVGERLGVTSEWVRQILNGALLRLRKPYTLKQIESWTQD